MIPAHETQFLDTVRAALGRQGPAPGAEELFGPPPHDLTPQREQAANRTRADRVALLETFTQKADLIHCPVITVPDAAEAARTIRELAQTIDPEWGTEKSIVAWDHPLIAALDLETALAPGNIPLFTAPDQADDPNRHTFRDQTIQSYIGITSADFAVADTATLVMEARPGQPRSVSLVPSVHIAVITPDQILADLKELYLHLNWDDQGNRIAPGNSLTFISGPSKTADIELHMVFGAHGPRQVQVIVITE